MNRYIFLLVTIFCLGTGVAKSQLPYKDILDFNATNGREPQYGKPTLSGDTLYGMTFYGGANAYGCVFSIDTDGNGYNDILDFNGPNGEYPGGSLLLLGNRLYGMTKNGGAHNDGVIFSINTNGTGYTDLFDFNGSNGSGPWGSLISIKNKLYGVTETGGVNAVGNIFSIDTNGYGYKDMHDFSASTGEYPFGSLSFSNGKLYGMTADNGAGSYPNGTIFSLDTNGNGFKTVFAFNGTNGQWPSGDVIVSGSKLYGMSQNGGRLNDGIIFSMDTNGTGYADLHDFNFTAGAWPTGSLTLAGGLLYGMTQDGGAHFAGIIFSVDTNGSNYNDILDFGNFNSPKGGYSLGSLIFSSGKLYGMTTSGGANNDGVIFNQAVLLTTVSVNANPYCNGGNTGKATCFGGWANPPYTYSWSPYGGTNNTVTGLSAGAYTVTVTDNDGLTATNSVTITQPNPLAILPHINANVSCNGGSNGIISAIINGGTLPYTYLWAPIGATLDTVTGLSKGTYTVSVTDNNGCSSTSSVTITQPNPLSISPKIITNINCYGDSGAAWVAVNGGTLPYTYLWAPGGTKDTATGLIAGTYTVSVTDFCGGTASAVLTLTQPSPIMVVKDSLPDALGCSGAAGVSVSGGVSPYIYLWSPGGHTNDTINHVCAGTYTCAITDNNGCSQSVSINIINCTNNYNEPICIVTTDTANNKCEIIWGRTNSPPAGGYGHYNVYRDTVPGFGLVHTQPLNSLSEYIDTASDPSAGPVSYKLSTTDSCGESALSSVHTTMYLTTAAGYNVYILNWTAYVGFTPSKYRIFRGPALNALVQIDSVPNNVVTYHDTLPPLGSFYAVEAVDPFGVCKATTHRPDRVSSALLSGSLSNGFNTASLLGIQNMSSSISGMKIYPNPSNGMVSLSYSISQSASVRVTIINELGQIIYDNTESKTAGKVNEQLNLESLASGIYSLRLQTGNGIIIQKLAIIRNR